jgi:hypothetical protein
VGTAPKKQQQAQNQNHQQQHQNNAKQEQDEDKAILEPAQEQATVQMMKVMPKMASLVGHSRRQRRRHRRTTGEDVTC